jgi:hypothetical protein
MEKRRCLSVSFVIPNASNVKLQHSIVRLLEKKKNNLKEKKLPNPVDPSFSQSNPKNIQLPIPLQPKHIQHIASFAFIQI